MAYTGLALNYLALGWTTSERQEFMRKALAAADKAIALDPELDEAHNALGWVKYLAQWDWSGAKQSPKRFKKLSSD